MLDHALSRGELKKQITTAHTATQYQSLGVYFRQHEEYFRARAKDEKAEWDRRKRYTDSIAAKYPKPVDSAHSLYDYYTYKADQMSHQAADYEKRAANVVPQASAAAE